MRIRDLRRENGGPVNGELHFGSFPQIAFDLRHDCAARKIALIEVDIALLV